MLEENRRRVEKAKQRLALEMQRKEEKQYCELELIQRQKEEARRLALELQRKEEKQYRELGLIQRQKEEAARRTKLDLVGFNYYIIANFILQ